MSINRTPKQIGVRELRDNIRKVVEEVRNGQPYMVLSNSQPIAVMLSHAEVVRWENVEFSLATLHGLGIYPELARGSSELASLVRGEREYSKQELEGLYRQRHDIVGRVRGGSVSEARARMAEILAEVQDKGQMWLMASGGELVVSIIRIEEYRRLLDLRRIVAWFRAAGLDLRTVYEIDEGDADEDEDEDWGEDKIVAWVNAYRAAAARAESAPAEESAPADSEIA
ncbi:MAG TPA: type II toxin-antitoxin system prevent-host-death family antitoxin [candidate division Zixibacteria bacterium]|nr:type II toxin-antitoxin system prevent-host-death family antitoxin [candidate division Zixibacteria bacterium]